ncbi:MAG: glycosyltransferase family 4 protein [Candidatus Baldrarchaeia archaeon]
MKILFFLGFPNPFPGAAWTRIGFFADQWSRSGHFIEILGTFTYTSIKKSGVKRLGKVNIFNLIFHIGVNNPLVFILNSLTSFIVSMIFLLARKPDIVIISVPTGDTGIGAMIACKLMRIKYVVDYRDEWEDYIISRSKSKITKKVYEIIKTLMTKVYAGSDLIVTVTPLFAKGLSFRGLKNVKIVPNGADVNVFKPCEKMVVRKKLGFREDDFILVYNGIIGEYYKLDIVIRALKKLEKDVRSKVKLLMVGDGSDLPKLMSMAKKLGLKDNVLYLGVKNSKIELAEILSAADVGIVPGLYSRGQLPVKVFEYCACGLPIIAVVPEGSLLQKLVEKYGIGITCPSIDEELANVICHLYENKSFREDSGKRARLLIEEKFDRNKIAKEYLNLIENILLSSLS